MRRKVLVLQEIGKYKLPFPYGFCQLKAKHFKMQDAKCTSMTFIHVQASYRKCIMSVCSQNQKPRSTKIKEKLLKIPSDLCKLTTKCVKTINCYASRKNKNFYPQRNCTPSLKRIPNNYQQCEQRHKRTTLSFGDRITGVEKTAN